MPDTPTTRGEELERRMHELENKISVLSGRITEIALLEYKISSLMADFREVRQDMRGLESEIERSMKGVQSSVEVREKERYTKEVNTLRVILGFLASAIVSMGVYIWRIVLDKGGPP